MKPLFEIGEEVILWPPNPKYQGCRGVVSKVADDNIPWNDGTSAEMPGYRISPDPTNHPGLIKEIWLRKIPKGCGKSFDQIMYELKRPVEV